MSNLVHPLFQVYVGSKFCQQYDLTRCEHECETYGDVDQVKEQVEDSRNDMQSIYCILELVNGELVKKHKRKLEKFEKNLSFNKTKTLKISFLKISNIWVTITIQWTCDTMPENYHTRIIEIHHVQEHKPNVSEIVIVQQTT